MPTTSLTAIGIMTGNSLDGADLVLSRFDADGSIADLCSLSKPYPEALTHFLREVRRVINHVHGEMTMAEEAFNAEMKNCSGALGKELFKGQYSTPTFDNLISLYTEFIADAVNELRGKARSLGIDSSIDLIGFHGQTCAHLPPSIAKSADPHILYTVQIGDGALLADLTNIPVVYDFRSDDLMNGGEAAPLAPMHHQHIGLHCKRSGHFPIAFLNAGNTGNISVISSEDNSDSVITVGWDAGPFNHLADKLMRLEKDQFFDKDGIWGSKGKVNLNLLGSLFSEAVVTSDGDNFLLRPPPKSSDPEWYRLIPEALREGSSLSFEDRIRTVEYFSAYCLFFSLSLLPKNLEMPAHFALCGGGWKNPIAAEHFQALVRGDTQKSPILPEHTDLFLDLSTKIANKAGGVDKVTCEPSLHYGFDGTVMEARLFADAAVCRVKNIPFTTPAITGVNESAVLGIIRFPQGKRDGASQTLTNVIAESKSLNATPDFPDRFDSRWSRASAGWRKKMP